MKRGHSHHRKLAGDQARDRVRALEIVQLLNRNSVEGMSLRSYCDRWLAAGRSVQGMGPLLRTLNDSLSRWKLWCLGAGVAESNESEASMPLGLRLWDPPEYLGGAAALVHGIEDEHYNRESLAALRFGLLVTGRDAKNLGKCRRCGAYFLNTSGHRNKVFCRP